MNLYGPSCSSGKDENVFKNVQYIILLSLLYRTLSAPKKLFNSLLSEGKNNDGYIN